jgi:hypothetical protein
MARPTLPVVGGETNIWGSRLAAVLADLQQTADSHDAAISAIPYGERYDVRDFGAVPDGTTDSRGAIMAALDAMLIENRGGYLYLGGGDYFINGTITLSAPNGTDLVGFGVVGDGLGQQIIQGADNDPLFVIEGRNIHSLFFGGFQAIWSSPADAAKPNRNVLRSTDAGDFYNSTLRDLSINNGHYAFHAGESKNVWGINHANIRIGAMSGGLATYTASAGQPNNGFDQIYIGAQTMVGPIFNFNAVNAQMDRIEINQALLGPTLISDNGGGNYVVGLFGCEGGTWSDSSNRLIHLDDSTLEARHIFLTGTTSAATSLLRTAGRGHIHIDFLIQDFEMTGSGKVFTTQLGGENLNNPNESRGEIIIGRIRSMTGLVPWSLGDQTVALTDAGNTESADAVRVTEWTGDPSRQPGWNEDADVDHANRPDAANVQAVLALSATRTYTLPHGYYLYSGFSRTFVKPVATDGDWVIRDANGNEVVTLAGAARRRVTLMWNRSLANGPSFDSWTVIDSSTWE